MVKLNLDFGALKSELSAEISARRLDEDKISLLDLVRLVQVTIPSIKIKNGVSIKLYFDELEFFISDDGDGERDRRMIRDLLISAYSINTLFAQSEINAVVYASVRSEILNSINGNCSVPRCHATVGMGLPASVRRMASMARRPRRRAVSTTERMSA